MKARKIITSVVAVLLLLVSFGATAQVDTILVGMTNSGGINDEGIIFKFDPDNSNFEKLYDFGGANGKWPWGQLMQASNGFLYGFTNGGGNSNRGVFFRFDPNTKDYVILRKFSDTTGFLPISTPVEYNGKLYGTLNGGGAYGFGTLFEYDLSTASYTVKVDFDSSSIGSYPWGGLVVVNNMLYGTTNKGGSSAQDDGVLFKYNPATGNLNVEVEFMGTSNGSLPTTELIQASNGKIYGCTQYGGISDRGTLFDFQPSNGILTKLHDFDQANGALPFTGVTQAKNGKLYGLAATGGGNNDGILFEYDITQNQFTNRKDFYEIPDGDFPESKLVEFIDGNLYGMANGGGANNDGTIFRFDPSNNTFTKLMDLEETTSGRNPIRGMTMAVIVPTGIDISGTTNRVNIYPNPCHDPCNIDLTGVDGSIWVKLINLTGQVLREEIVPGGGILPFDIGKVVPGYYLLEMSNGQQTWSSAILVK